MTCCVQQEHRLVKRAGTASRCFMALTVTALALFATGVGDRPEGASWAVVYDLVLYNLVYLGAACVCFTAALPIPRDRLAWAAMAISLLFGITGNLVYTLSSHRWRTSPIRRSRTSSTWPTSCPCTWRCSG